MWNVETVDSKKEIRVKFRHERDSIDPQFKLAAERSIQQKLQKLLIELAIDTKVVAYRGLRSEVNLDQFLGSYNQCRFVFPKVKGEILEFYEVEGLDSFVEGAFGVLEPEGSNIKMVDLNQCKIVLVPGLAFDRMGRRLGSGKGFYDKALAQYKGVKVGVAFKSQITNFELPHENHDIFMDYIVTEDFTLLPVYQKRN